MPPVEHPDFLFLLAMMRPVISPVSLLIPGLFLLGAKRYVNAKMAVLAIGLPDSVVVQPASQVYSVNKCALRGNMGQDAGKNVVVLIRLIVILPLALAGEIMCTL